MDESTLVTCIMNYLSAKDEQIDPNEITIQPKDRKIVVQGVDSFHKLAQSLGIEGLIHQDGLNFSTDLPSCEPRQSVPQEWAFNLPETYLDGFLQKYSGNYDIKEPER